MMSTYNNYTTSSSIPNGNSHLYLSKSNMNKHAPSLDSTYGSDTSSNTSTLCKKNKPKFDILLDRDIDINKIDIKRVAIWLDCYFERHHARQSKLIKDLILDFLKSERYPDAQVLQHSIIDLGIICQTKLKKLMRNLWDSLLDEQDIKSVKKHKLVKDSSSTTIATMAKKSEKSNNDCYNHKLYSGTRDARKSVNTK